MPQSTSQPPAKPEDLPDLFRPADSRWASRAAARGEIRRLAQGLYTPNLDEVPEQLLRRLWSKAAEIYFPNAVVVDRSAATAGPASDGSLFLDSGPGRSNPRAVRLPGLHLRPRHGPGPMPGDMPFMGIHQSGTARMLLDNMRPSRARSGVARTLKPHEVEERLDRIARTQGDDALNELRDEARDLAGPLDAAKELEALDRLIGAMLGTRDADLETASGRARRDGLGYDGDRLYLFEILRAELASQELPERSAEADPERLNAFFEAYFSNWIEGTEFEVGEAEDIVFHGIIPTDRPADAHDIRGTFDAIVSQRFRGSPAQDPDSFEDYLKEAHELIMGGRPGASPGKYKERANRAGMTRFVLPDLVRGTLRQGFEIASSVPAGMKRAIYLMFLVAEVHPFADGNGRVARLTMNAELTSSDLTRFMVPLSFRDEYLQSLRALSRSKNPTPIWRMADRAQRWTSLMPWTGHDRVLALLESTNALATPEEAEAKNLHLLDPPERTEDGLYPAD